MPGDDAIKEPLTWYSGARAIISLAQLVGEPEIVIKFKLRETLGGRRVDLCRSSAILTGQYCLLSRRERDAHPAGLLRSPRYLSHLIFQNQD